MWTVWVRDSGLSDLSIRLVIAAGSNGGEVVEMGFGGVLKLVSLEVVFGRLGITGVE